MERLLSSLRALAEPTRLRIAAICARGEVTVTDLTRILGQSQPRVSRHLKVLCAAGLLDRFREGAWVFYRLARDGLAAELAVAVLERLSRGASSAGTELLALDSERLEEIKRRRAEEAAAYFRANAHHWDTLRALHIDEREVEQVLLDHLGPHQIDALADIGTGTGRVLTLLGPYVKRAVGIDISREMLSIARVNIEQAGLANVMVRLGDMYQLPLPGGAFDAAVVHQVLHYAEEPGRVIAEAGRILRPGGRLAVVDFAPHDQEGLRVEHHHRRLGFSDAEVEGWCRDAGLEPYDVVRLPGRPLTVTLWLSARLGGAQARAQDREAAVGPDASSASSAAVHVLGADH